jgi:multidrug efflux pump subunit AcrA (membrane-fusion protein)
MVKKAKNFITRNPWKTAFIVLIIIAVVWWWSPRKQDTTVVQDFLGVDTIVGTGDLEASITLQGTTQFADSQRLTFMTKGKVQSVAVKVGDKVKKGQILASITTDDLDTTISQERIDIQNQEKTLQDLLDGYNLELEYLQQKADYDALLLKLKTIDQDHLLAMEELQQKIEDAQKSYNDTKKDYEELLSGSNSVTADLALSSTIRKRNTTFQNAVLDLKNIITTVQSSLDAFDQTMMLTDTYKYGKKNIYIGAKDQNLKNQSESLFRTLSNQLSQLDTLYKKLDTIAVQDLTNEQILEAYTLVKDMGANLVTWGEISYDMFKASIENTSYSQLQIDTDASSALKNQSTGISYIQKYATIVDALAALEDDTSLEDTKLKMDKAKTSLDKLELQVDVLKAEQKKEKAGLQDQMDTVQRNITKIQGGESLKETQIITARNRLSQLKNSLNNSLRKYEDYRLEANFDGVVTQMDLQV